MSPSTLARLIRTVRHLRVSQLLWRCRAVARRRWPATAAVPESAAPLTREQRRREEFPEIPLFHRDGLRGEACLRELEQGRLTLLNRTGELGRERPDWCLGNPTSQRLWVITLHYHGWAYELADVAASGSGCASRAAGMLVHYLDDWIERCRPTIAGARELAWNSFAIATRLSWWIRIRQRMRGSGHEVWGGFEPRLLDSAWRQAAHLHDHLEWDLRGNHLLRDLVGLAWAGRLFDGAEARRWTRTATSLVSRQLDEQILPDGAHFERSPMYHVHVMEDILSLALLLEDRTVVERLERAWIKMARYLDRVRHPDGMVPLLNDGGLRSVCEPARMLGLRGDPVGPAPPRGGGLFPDSGLVVWHGDPWSVFFDVGPIGPDEAAGHGHADTLTVECSYRGRRVFVDPGTHAYDDDDDRRYDRSTAAHNTVSIDGACSSELWHIFRAGRRARPLEVRASFGEESFEASATHDGYARLPGRPAHRRQVAVRSGGELLLTDRLEGSGRHRAVGGLLLDPRWTAERNEAGWLLSSDDRRLRVSIHGEGDSPTLELMPAEYHPDYGVRRETVRLQWTVDGSFPTEIQTLVEPA